MAEDSRYGEAEQPSSDVEAFSTGTFKNLNAGPMPKPPVEGNADAALSEHAPLVKATRISSIMSHKGAVLPDTLDPSPQSDGKFPY